MAASPRWKVYSRDGHYQAACNEIEAAAAVVSFYGPLATIRDGHRRIVYIEGQDGFAANSYDAVGQVIHQRQEARNNADH